MTKFINSFIHTSPDIHGMNCVEEFLVPDILDPRNKLIGIKSGNEYDIGLVTGTHLEWDEDDIINFVGTVKKIKISDREEKKQILKHYISQMPEMRKSYLDHIVMINADATLIPIEPRKAFLDREIKLYPLSEEKKAAYRNLALVCLNRSDFIKFDEFLSGLNDYEGHYEHYTTLNYVMGYLDTNGIHFIMGLDWSQGIKDLIWRIKSASQNNFNLEIDLPGPEKYPTNASVSLKGVFRDFDESVKTHDLKIGFIDTKNDEYILVLYRIKDTNTVTEAITKIGYDYLDLNSPELSFLSIEQ